jgi:hypothetical protein
MPVDSLLRNASRQPLLRWLVALPPLAATLVMCVVAAAARGGIQMFADEQPQNASEAAIHRDLPAIVRFRQTSDLRRRYPLRTDYIEFNVRAATPLEASVLSRSGDVVRFIVRAAAPLPVERERATCLAVDVNADEGTMSALLDGAPRPACTPGAALSELRESR